MRKVTTTAATIIFLFAFLKCAPATASGCIREVKVPIRFERGAVCWTYHGMGNTFLGNFGSGQLVTAKAIVEEYLGDDPAVNLEGAVARLVGIEGGVISGVFNLESSGVGASDRRPRHDERYHEDRVVAAAE